MQQGKAGTSAAAPSMKTIWQGTGPTDLETITEWVSSCCYLFPDYPPPHLLPPPSTPPPPPHPPTAAFFLPFFHFCENVYVCACVFACSSTETPSPPRGGSELACTAVFFHRDKNMHVQCTQSVRWPQGLPKQHCFVKVKAGKICRCFVPQKQASDVHSQLSSFILSVL